MPIQFVIGRAGSGKSTWCLDQIRRRLQEEPEGHPLILLVPEQATFQAEYALVSTPGLAGTIRAQVLSFRRLAWRVMQETGGTARLPINDSGKKMLLHKIIHKRRGELRLFHQSADQMGFLEQLNQLFGEWKRYCVDSGKLRKHIEAKTESLAGAAGLLRDKLHDLQLVYDALEAELSQMYLDGEDYLAMLAERLDRCDYMRRAEIWVDGFNGLTSQEFAVLEQMMRHSRSLTVTLCLDREYGPGEQPHELELFHLPARTMAALQEAADRAQVGERPVLVLGRGTLPRFCESPALARLETALARRPQPSPEHSQPVPDVSPDISLYEAASRRAEVEGVAREMIRLVRDGGYRWHELAVRVRNIEHYGDLLQTVFTHYGIPFFIDQKRTVLHHPLVEFIRSALEVVGRRWKYDAVFRCIKTEFLFPVHSDDEAELRGREERGAMDRLENFVLATGIQGSRWTDEHPWVDNMRESLEDEYAAPAGQASPHNERLERCRKRVAGPLSQLEKDLKAARNVKEMTEALFGLLQKVGAAQRLEQWSRFAAESGHPEKAREHTQVWGSVMDLFDQLVELMGEETVSLDLFTTMLETGMESLRLGLVPPAMDQVLIGSIDRTRSGQMKCAFVIGVNDGVMPARIPETGVLTEAEREILLESGLPMADGSRRKLLDEQFLIYSTLCTPSQHLWLSYALADEEGKSLLPSEMIRQMQRRFPTLGIRQLQAEPAAAMEETEQLAFIAHPGSVLSHLTVQLRQWLRGAPISSLWWDAYDWFAGQPGWRTAMERMVRALSFANREAPLRPDTSLLLYGTRLQASVSRLELFAACPFSQFASYGLRLQERRVFRLAAPDIGQLFHAALSVMALRFQSEGIEWGDLDDVHIRARADEAVEELSPRLRSEILLSSGRYRYIAGKLTEIVGRAAAILGEHSRRGAFRPAGLELGFGQGQPLPPLVFELDHGRTMELRGRIDRVDLADGEEGALLRVIDYKSSRTSLRLPELYYGLSLQMLAYLDVVLTHAERWLGRKALPAGVLYFHVHNPVIQSSNGLPPERAAAEMFKRYKMRGLVVEDAETVRLMDDGLRHSSGHSRLLPVALKTDGQFYKSSSVASREKWDTLRGHVRDVIRQIGSGIADGEVAITPYRMGQEIPCNYCAYKPVCQFDPQFDGNDFRLLRPLAKEEAWEAIGGTNRRGGESSGDS